MPTPGLATLSTIRTAAAQRADMATPSATTFVPLSEWLTIINASYAELYDLLVQKFGDDYFFAGTPDNWYQFTTTTSAGYVLPDGSVTYKLVDNSTTAPAFYKLLGVDVKYGSAWVEMDRMESFRERNRGTALAGSGVGRELRYWPSGNYLWLTPTPQAGQFVRLWYTPRLTALSGDSDTLDGVSGWEEYVVVDAARKALIKEESDTSALDASKMALIQRIEAAAENRDVSAPQRTTDARGYVSSDDEGFRYG